MQLKLLRKAAKQLDRVNEPFKSKIVKALQKLEKELPDGDIKRLAGQECYRLRVGSWRVLYGVDKETILVYKIARRGQVYKE